VVFSASAAAFWMVDLASRHVMGRAQSPDSPLVVVSPPSRDIVLDDADGRNNPDPVNATFRIFNGGAHPALIKAVESSCGCALPTLSSRQIPPGGEITASVAISPPKEGTQTFTIRLYLDKPVRQTLLLPGSITRKGPGGSNSGPTTPAEAHDHAHGPAAEAGT
jgi:hypothetical protein